MPINGNNIDILTVQKRALLELAKSRSWIHEWLSVIVFAGVSCWVINDHVDQCYDQSSGHYIAEEHQRAEACDR